MNESLVNYYFLFFYFFRAVVLMLAINYPQQALCSWSTAAGTVKGHLYGQVQPKTTRSASEAKVPANLQKCYYSCFFLVVCYR